jgi:hypothetical protein
MARIPTTLSNILDASIRGKAGGEISPVTQGKRRTPRGGRTGRRKP